MGSSPNDVVLAFVARSQIETQIDRPLLRHLCDSQPPAYAAVHNDLLCLFQRHHLQNILYWHIRGVCRGLLYDFGFGDLLCLLGDCQILRRALNWQFFRREMNWQFLRCLAVFRLLCRWRGIRCSVSVFVVGLTGKLCSWAGVAAG